MHVRLVMMCLSTAIDKKVLEVDDESIPFSSSLCLAGVSCSSRCNGYVSKDIGYFFFILDERKEWEVSFIEGGIGDTIDLFSEFSLKLLYILCIYICVSKF